MTIGVDVDGVLCNLDRYVRKYFEKYLKSKNIEYKLDKSKVRFCNQYGVAAEIEDEFWEQHNFHYAKKVSMHHGADVITHKLHRQGHKIIIITSRYKSDGKDESGENMRLAIKSWLAKNNIYYDEIFFTNDRQGKTKIVADRGIDIMIEDSVRNILEISALVPVIIFRNPSNRRLKGGNSFLANGWRDIFKIVQNIEKRPKGLT